MTTPGRALLLGGALALVGCTQAALPGTGGLNGVNTVAAVRVDGFDGGVVVGAQYGQIAFITSTNSDDIKGLDLIVTNSSQARAYVPAPNPLQPLSIPTVNQPIELAPSVRYGPIQTSVPFFASTGIMDGQVLTGALLFVRGAASPNISVIGTANVPESLRQLTNGLLQQSAGVVTALSARMTTTEANVVLYYATFDGQDGTVWERVLQNPQSRSPSFTGPFPTSLTYVPDCSGPPPVVPTTTLYVCPPRPVRTYQDASVSALQVLPTLPSDPPLPVLGGLEGGRVGVAIRNLVPPLNDATLSSSGELLIIDPAVPADLDANGTSSDPFFRLARYLAPFEPQPPLIPGAPAQPPIRALLTHPRAFNVYGDGGYVPGPDGNPEVLVYEGARLFAVLDESSCYGAQECTGLVAVDASPFLTDGGPNANYGLLSFDNSDCLSTALDTNNFPYPYCQNAVGTLNRMLPLRFKTGSIQGGVNGNSAQQSGVIQGVAIESTVGFPNATSFTLGVVPLLGVATISAESLDHTAAQIFFFDAVGLRVVNENPTSGILSGVTLVAGTLEHFVDGGAGGAVNFVTANVGVGLYPTTEIVTITNEGQIPGLALILGIPDDGGVLSDGGLADVLVWPVPDAGSLSAANAVELNDIVIPVNLSGTLCVISQGTSVPVNPTAFVIGVGDGGTSLITTNITIGQGPLNLLQACPGASGYIAFAGPGSTNPYLVAGSTSGLLGRMQSGQQPPPGQPYVPAPVFTVPNATTEAFGLSYPRYYDQDVPPGTLIQGNTLYPPGSDAGVPMYALTLSLPPPEEAFLSTPGAFYTFNLSAGVLPASLPIDSVSLGFGGLFLPGGVAQTRVTDVNGENVVDVVTYPSSSTVIDFVPAAIIPNFPNSGPINVHF
jgi:hypothetical protein